MTKFPQRLRELRKENGWTQDELAKKANASRSSISMYESGERDPNTEIIDTFCDLFNVDMDYLLGRSSLKHAANMDFLCSNINLETIMVLNQLNEEQQKRLVAVAKAMFELR